MLYLLLILFLTCSTQAQDLVTLFKDACRHAQEHNYYQAIEELTIIVSHRPDFVPALYNLAYCLKSIGHVHEALHYYEQVLKKEPNNAQAHYGCAQALLATGDFKRGWDEFQWRLVDYENWQQQPRNLSEFNNKKIVLRAEFGLGDTIQFIRYAKVLKKYGAVIYVQTFDSLKPLFSLCDYIDKVIPIGHPLPTHDYEIPLLSMPRVCNTTKQTVPLLDTYLKADKKLITKWRPFFEKKKTFNVGICWQAKPTIFLEDNPYTKRSIPLALFEQLAVIPGVHLFSLQKKFVQEELTQIDFTIETFNNDFDTTNGRFMDTAAIMMHLDLIISVDTSIVHLAGALGKPVWVLLPSVPEWRWMCGVEWYANMMFFKQKEMGNWQEVFNHVKKELKKVIALP